MRKLLQLSVIIFTFFSACDNGKENVPDVSNINVDFKVHRLDQALFKCKTREDIKQFLNQHKNIANKFFRLQKYPHDSILINQLHRLITHPSYADTVHQSIDQVFGDFSETQAQFEKAFKRIKYHYPAYDPQDIYTMVSGMSVDVGKDLLINEDIIVISLDFFLGNACKYKPQIPDYILRRYKKAYIVPHCIMRISQKYNNSNNDRSLLAEMVYYGKTYYFKDKILPHAHDSLITGYTQKELERVNKNEHIIWSHFIKNELLYETRHSIIRQFTEERPKTTEIGSKCPGRVGRWIGWQIVKAYMDKHPEKNLVDLMKIKDPIKVFNASKYKPKIPN